MSLHLTPSAIRELRELAQILKEMAYEAGEGRRLNDRMYANAIANAERLIKDIKHGIELDDGARRHAPPF